MSTPLRGLIASQVNLPVEQVDATSHLFEDLGFDSLDTLELIMAVEEQFGVEVDETELQIYTVEQAETKLAELLALKKALNSG